MAVTYRATIYSLGEIQGYASAALAGWTTEEVNNQVRLGNDEYVISVDGALTESRDTRVFSLVKKIIRVDFLRSALDVAVDVMKREMEREIRKFVTSQPPTVFKNTKFDEAEAGRLVENIRIFLGRGETGQVIEITDAKETKVRPGDWIAMTPDTYLTWLMNSPLYRFKKEAEGKIGFLGRTARVLRRKLRANKKLSPLRIKAAFSRTIARKMGVSEAKDGKNAVLYGQPVIFIRLRRADNG